MEADIYLENANREGCKQTTELSVDLKTVLHSDKRMKTGKEYLGVLRRDSEAVIDEFRYRDPHYTFVETLPWCMKRNSRVYVGKYITITRQDNGNLRPNFRPMPVDLSVDNYAFEVYRELRQALKGLVEE